METTQNRMFCSISFKEVLAFLIGFTVSSLIVINVAKNYTYLKSRYNLSFLKDLNEPARNAFLKYGNYNTDKEWQMRKNGNK